MKDVLIVVGFIIGIPLALGWLAFCVIFWAWLLTKFSDLFGL